jgi:hypothetical protein
MPYFLVKAGSNARLGHRLPAHITDLARGVKIGGIECTFGHSANHGDWAICVGRPLL